MPVERSKINEVGDLVVTEPEALRVLAAPLSLRLFDLVRRLGPATSAQLATEIDEDEAAVQDCLTAMEATDLIDVDGERPPRWSTPARGIYFEIPEHGEQAQRAARTLSSSMLARASELPPRWVDEAEPQLSVEWARAAGLFNSRVRLTADELRGLQDELEHLLERFTTRDAAALPPGTTTVRILAFFMPDPA